MRRALRSLFAALLAAWATVALAAPAVVGIAAAVVNDVRVKPASVSAFAAARLRQRIALADRVRTGAKSRLQLLLLDKTRFSVGANAALTIDKFVYNANGGSISASVAKGAFRFMSGKARSGSKTVRTPSATIGIRGTVFDGAVGEHAVAIAQREAAIPRDTQHDPLTATLVVLRGPGAATQAGLAVGAVDVTGASQTVTLDEPLLAAYVPYAGAEPIGPFRISLSGLGQLNDFILPATNQTFAPLDQSLFETRRPRRPNGRGIGPSGPDVPGGDDFGYGIPDLDSFPRPPADVQQPSDPVDPPRSPAPNQPPTHTPTQSPNYPGVR